MTLVRVEYANPQSRVKHSATESLRSCITVYTLIAPLTDILMFYIKYFTMHKVHMHAGGIRLCVCTVDNPLAKARGLSYISTYAQTMQ